MPILVPLTGMYGANNSSAYHLTQQVCPNPREYKEKTWVQISNFDEFMPELKTSQQGRNI